MQRLAILFLVFAVPCSLHAQAKPASLASSQNDASCRAFVQEFYNWYVKAINKEHHLDGTEMISKYRKSSFDPELLRQLNVDLAAAKRNKDEIVGLDFDPFVNAQEFAGTYTARNVTRKGDNYFIDVYGDWGKDAAADAKKAKKPVLPDVVPELAFRNGAWVFINFHYPSGEKPEDKDLLATLKYLREERQKHRK